ncbi:hypothetical protein BH23ACT10_BH23ACT10_18470 [soil metagenome]
MSDPTTDGPSEEEMRAYLESMRAAQPVEIIVQSFGILATASEVKLGRDDARVLIDGMAALLEATADQMPPEIVERMRQTVSQLQLAQVQVEREGVDADESDDAEQVAQGSDPAGAAQATQPPPAQQQQPDAGSRLWIPGRD